MLEENKIFSNEEILLKYELLKDLYTNEDLKLPITFNYYLFKNIKIFEKLITSIRSFYSQNFSDLDLSLCSEEERNKYNEFCNIKNEVKIVTCPLSLLKDINLSLKDYQAIDFMIKEE